jgi:hypothetical protein
MGSVLRLPFLAYYKHIYLKRLPVKKKIIPVNNKDEDLLTEEQMSAMSELDKEVFALRKLARSLMPTRVFDTMLKCDLIGSRHNDKGSMYIQRTEFGRVIKLSEGDQHTLGYGMVYIVLTGQIQLRLSTSQQKAGKKVSHLAYSTNMDNKLELKANDVPIMQLECGTWLTVNKDILTVGQHAIEKIHSHPHSRPHSSRIMHNHIAHTARSVGTSNSAGIALNISKSPPKYSQSTKDSSRVNRLNNSSPVALTPLGGGELAGNSSNLDESRTGIKRLPAINISNISNASPGVTPKDNSSNDINSGSKPVQRTPASSRQHKKQPLSRALQAAYELEQLKLEKKLQENMNFAYKLYLQFTHDSVYLAIPYSQFVAAMKESKSTETNKRKT